MNPYRSTYIVPAWRIRADRFLPFREFRWYRRRIGGVWVLLLHHFVMPGGYECWHSETLDAPVRTHCMALEREIWL